jgi:molybdate transport system substrate-binding protein
MPRTLLSLVLSVLLPVAAYAETIRVGAAVSLRDAFDAIARTYAADTGDAVEFVYGSSGQVAAQVRSGAGLDAFVSAANRQVDDLAKDGLIDPATRRVVAGNRLVLVVPRAAAAGGPKSLADLATAGRVAVGEPRTVPAGQYAAQVLKTLNLTAALDRKLVYGNSVRQVLAYVERGEVAAGLVYATDARAAGVKVVVVATAEETTHEPIVYPAAVVSAGVHKDAARRFLDYLATPAARDALAARGFTPPARP